MEKIEFSSKGKALRNIFTEFSPQLHLKLKIIEIQKKSISISIT